MEERARASRKRYGVHKRGSRVHERGSRDVAVVSRALMSRNLLAPVHRSAVEVRADFDRVYEQFKTIIEGKPVTAAGMTLLAISAIQLVERVSAESGDRGGAKQQLVIMLLQKLVADSPTLGADEKALLDALILSVVPGIIDGLVAASNGEVLKKAGSAFKKLLAKCGCGTSEAGATN